MTEKYFQQLSLPLSREAHTVARVCDPCSKDSTRTPVVTDPCMRKKNGGKNDGRRLPPFVLRLPPSRFRNSGRIPVQRKTEVLCSGSATRVTYPCYGRPGFCARVPLCGSNTRATEDPGSVLGFRYTGRIPALRNPAFRIMPAFLFLAFLSVSISSLAGPASGTVQSTRLYTSPDALAGGGILGVIAQPRVEIKGAFAVNSNDPSKVYRGKISEDGREFSFTGLPVGKYDLMILYPGDFYEGFRLHRGEGSLTKKDLTHIDETVGRSVPFFDTKKIHRVTGSTGTAGAARAVLQELRTNKIVDQQAVEMVGYQIRSIKLAMLEDVGVGWHLVRSREIVRTEVAPGLVKGLIRHHYHAPLGGIRVTRTVKNLGQLNLGR